ncbi:MAG TPA: hypothetical protein VEK33_09400 [Terriglobales bacterium]|nr:hypothetical protein [Terriglobales bacterium]
MFYFEQLLQTALDGIDSQGISAAAVQIGSVILIVSLLFAAYEAYSNGGDVRALGLAGIKYLVLGLVFLNYQGTFRGLNQMFSAVADFMYNLSGIGDVYRNWLNAVANYVQSGGWSALFALVPGQTGASGLLSVLLILIGFIIFPVMYTLFALFYAVYGSVLYVTGPFVLALLPSRSFGRLARTYMINLITFQAWGVIYAILQVLMSAVNLSSPQVVLEGSGVLNGFVGSSQMILLAASTIIFAVTIGLIPFVASRIVRGDIGSTLFTVAHALTIVVGTTATLAAAAGPSYFSDRAFGADLSLPCSGLNRGSDVSDQTIGRRAPDGDSMAAAMASSRPPVLSSAGEEGGFVKSLPIVADGAEKYPATGAATRYPDLSDDDKA